MVSSQGGSATTATLQIVSRTRSGRLGNGRRCAPSATASMAGATSARDFFGFGRQRGGAAARWLLGCPRLPRSAPGSASATWHCSLDLPNSFAPGDGLRLQAEGFGRTKDEASELACRQAVARLLVENPSEVVLRPKHWNISITDLLVGMPSADAPHQALPVHVRARSREAGADAQVLSAAEVDDRVAEILRQCLTTHGGSFDPSRISHKATGLGPADERMYSRLNKLLSPEGLRPWVEKHPEFAWARSGAKAMVITWGVGVTPSAASASAAPEASPQQQRRASGVAPSSASASAAPEASPPATSSASAPVAEEDNVWADLQ